MATSLTALFPDRETANHAISDLKAANFNASRINAEDFERADYYQNQMPQGATLVTVDITDDQTEVRSILQRTGGQVLEGDGSIDATPSSWHGERGGSVPVAGEEKQALSEKQAEEQSGVGAEERARGRSFGGRLNNTGANTSDDEEGIGDRIRKGVDKLLGD